MKKLPHLLFLISIVAAIVLFVFVKPIPQALHYHNFSDVESAFGINNFYNVSSNIGFILVGIYSIYLLINKKLKSNYFVVISIGFILTGLGSSYYHYKPNNATLVWDRLPMTIVFTTFFAQVYSWYINKKQALIIWRVGFILGVFSVWYWHFTETLNRGDLRLYALVQYLPILLILIIISLKKSEDKKTNKYFIQIAIAYFIAKIFENFDEQFHSFFRVIGGHPLKHIAASFAAYYIIVLIKYKEQKAKLF